MYLIGLWWELDVNKCQGQDLTNRKGPKTLAIAITEVSVRNVGERTPPQIPSRDFFFP